MAASRLAWPLWGLSMVLAVGSTGLWVRNGLFDARSFSAFLFLVPGYATVGALIAVRRRNRVGWLFLGIGLAAAALSLGFQYSLRAYVIAPGSLPASPWVVWLQDTLVSVSVIGLIYLVLLFPDGRLPSRRWRPVALVLATLSAVILLWGMVRPDPLYLAGALIPNPARVQALQHPVVARFGPPLGVLGFVLLIATLLAVAAAPFLRFRHAGPRQRQQLKWLAFATGASALAIFTGNLFPPGQPPQVVLVGVGATGIAVGIPAAVGIAILRHGLYDIDRLISRTLTYGLLTVVLGAVYAAVVLVLGLGFGGVGGELPSWAVAGATLVVAALFQPARRRIQAGVDRRFNRGRYDAATTIEAFSARLRDEIDLDTLTDELLGVTDQTMQPTHVSLWLRPMARAGTRRASLEASMPPTPNPLP
jgi:hypothetical protein